MLSPVGQGPTPALPRSGYCGQPPCPLKGSTSRDSGLHPSTTDPPIPMTQTEIQPPELLEPVFRHANVSPAIGHTMLIPGTICDKDTLMVVDTAAHISMISQPFFDSLNHHTALLPELIGIKNAEHGSHMQCHLTRQLPLTINNKQSKVGVAVGPITDHFILGLDFLLEHNCVVDIDSYIHRA